MIFSYPKSYLFNTTDQDILRVLFWVESKSRVGFRVGFAKSTLKSYSKNPTLNSALSREELGQGFSHTGCTWEMRDAPAASQDARKPGCHVSRKRLYHDLTRLTFVVLVMTAEHSLIAHIQRTNPLTFGLVSSFPVDCDSTCCHRPATTTTEGLQSTVFPYESTFLRPVQSNAD